MIALTRQIGELDRCELTYRPREPIDLARARLQHRQYEQLLEHLGVEVVSLPAEPGLPDAVFVEDAAVVLDECAVLPTLGAQSRRPEVESLAVALRAHRPLVRLGATGTLDGGDVLRMGRTLYVGLSTRTNVAGIAALRQKVEPLGYDVRLVPVQGCLHLKSACTALDSHTLLVNPERVDRSHFPGAKFLTVSPDEPDAANVLWVGGSVVASTSFPRTLERIAAGGFHVLPLDNSELVKAEGGLTCTSLLFE